MSHASANFASYLAFHLGYKFYQPGAGCIARLQATQSVRLFRIPGTVRAGRRAAAGKPA